MSKVCSSLLNSSTLDISDQELNKNKQTLFTNDLTIGWQNLNLLSHPNTTLAPQARASGENLNYVTLAPQARPSGEDLNYLLSC